MKAIITKIQDGSVFAKSVNPLGEKPEQVYKQIPKDLSFLVTHEMYVRWANEAATKWQQAESDRVELPLDEDSVFSRMVNCTTLKAISVAFKINDEIQVTREGNFFNII